MIGVLSFVVLSSSPITGLAHANTLKSPHYEFQETDLGGGGLIPSSSANYQTVLSVGDSAIGNSNSNSFQFEGGSQTTKDPSLALSIMSSSADFGTFSSTAPSTATIQFSVIDYTSYGYVVQILGGTPTYKGHSIPAMNNGSGGPTTSSPGTEQFGINLVENTDFCGSGCNLGSDPNYGQFGAATAGPTANYDSANHFYYSNGDTIAESPKSSGEIIYTISFIVNVTSLTVAGSYTTNQTLVCTGTY